MTTGTSSWKGLGMGLNGEYELTQITAATDMFTLTAASGGTGDFLVLRDSDKSEVWNIDYRGVTDLTITSTETTFAFDLRATMSSATGWNLAGNFAVDLNVTGAHSAQSFAVRAAMDASGTPQLGGRACSLYCYMLSPSCTIAQNAAFIHFSDGLTQLQYFFTIADCTLDQGCFITLSEPASTHGLRIMHGTTTYYIMCTSCLT